MPILKVENWGLIRYATAIERQDAIQQKVINQKLLHRDDPLKNPFLADNYLVFCEHNPVYTMGNKGKMEHLLLNQKQMTEYGIDFFQTRRGGDITYHGPGQLVVYPILDLDQFFTDIHKYLRLLEETVIRTLAEFGLLAGRIEGLTGVWIETNAINNADARKICAIGVRCSRWVTQHGLALNVNTKLNDFDGIIPCGIADHQVTSIEKELGIKVPLNKVQTILEKHFKDLFITEKTCQKTLAKPNLK